MWLEIGVAIVVVFLLFNGIFFMLNWGRQNREYEFFTKEAASQLYSKPIDLKRYTGLWYEVAVLPNSFESNCIGATANYTLNKEGIDVLNTCVRSDGTKTVANGVAVLFEDAQQYKDRWIKVSFFGSSLPNFYSQLFSGDYLVLHVEDSGTGPYSQVIVGSIDKKYLWILSRVPNLSQTQLQSLLAIATAKGYDVSQLLIRNPLVYNNLK